MTVVGLGLPAIASAPATSAPTDGPLIDTFGRVATDLRVSLTDRCNLRCTYCMPAEGLDWLESDRLLRPEELTRLLRIAVERLGITSVRFTGGEPLVAKHLEDVIAATASLRPQPEITLTTNGIGLARRADALRQAGLKRINVSLDTVDPARFAAITRRDRLPDVLAGLAAAKAAGLDPVKVNAVLDPVTGLDDAVALLRFCLEHGYQLRIIEQMPLDAGREWQRGRAIGADEILETLQQHFELSPDTAPRGSAPAELWRVGGATPGTVGIIASVSHAFCSACDRTRLTADGQVRNCLFARQETDLRLLMRSGADDAAVEAAWRTAMWAKAAGHGINDPGFVQPDRPMSAIGG
ncbi:cyclic pyranopterin monophosphate synthase subunit MoaA [Mycolicibacterium rutilum]|uniref:GTP 3',8-cyclase n=1 Tax=Mycolicibacterium rutilum TaxID=370526 RepID=A0A1H6JVK8_MYCRU|nr:GTP 3',8-cyclase MoaA [Mycolicibacterium rutilum]SEH63989.1 cyclic pyranopterin monophosphate synthase subunit MoaA [Mycolicibacterium rutilum]